MNKAEHRQRHVYPDMDQLFVLLLLLWGSGRTALICFYCTNENKFESQYLVSAASYFSSIWALWAVLCHLFLKDIQSTSLGVSAFCFALCQEYSGSGESMTDSVPLFVCHRLCFYCSVSDHCHAEKHVLLSIRCFTDDITFFIIYHSLNFDCIPNIVLLSFES